MATTFDFFSNASSDGTNFTGADSNGSITATVNDGVVSVGDQVTFAGFSGSTLTESGIGVGGTGYYLGTATIDGETAYIFGANAVQADNTALFATFDTNFAPGGAGSELTTLVNNIGTTTLGSDPACFSAGTLIATPAGEVPVETLRIGDLVSTADGRAVPVKWIGRQTVVRAFAGQRGRPVRIIQGALGDGLPHTDLVLTADHAMIVNELAVNAGALVNGTTILFVPMEEMPDRYTWFHVETEAHEEIVANGAPAETFVDYIGRRGFDNYQEYLDRYGAERVIPEMKRPRVSSQRMLPAHLRMRLGLPDHGAEIAAEASALMQRLKAA